MNHSHPYTIDLYELKLLNLFVCLFSASRSAKNKWKLFGIKRQIKGLLKVRGAVEYGEREQQIDNKKIKIYMMCN